MHNILAQSQFSPLDVYWILINRQTKRQAKYIYRLGFPSSAFISIVNMFYFIHCKTIKKFRGFYKRFRGFFKLNENRILLKANFKDF